MARRQTKLNDFTTEVRTEEQATDAEEYFWPQRRRQLEAAGVDLQVAAKVVEALDIAVQNGALWRNQAGYGVVDDG